MRFPHAGPAPTAFRFPPHTPISPLAIRRGLCYTGCLYSTKQRIGETNEAMYNFANDYSEGGHERILAALTETSRTQSGTYGLDAYSDEARALILGRLNHPESAVHFLVAGTQTNLVLIAAALRPHQGVIAASTGHINVHESGAIEATGHKVLAIPSSDGKVYCDAVERVFAEHYADPTAEHMVQPAMLYISLPTEVGTIYSKDELAALYALCHRYHARVYVDGARLGCALTAEGGDVTLYDLARYTDAFTIGGTKNGALFGEALVINDPALNADFRYIQKQRGAFLAKGRLLGQQYIELFKDGLYESLARHANTQAQRIRKAVAALGYGFLTDSPTNQVFPILPKPLLASLDGKFGYAYWQPIDEAHDAVRFCASWATPPEAVDALIEAIRAFS